MDNRVFNDVFIKRVSYYCCRQDGTVSSFYVLNGSDKKTTANELIQLDYW